MLKITQTSFYNLLEDCKAAWADSRLCCICEASSLVLQLVLAIVPTCAISAVSGTLLLAFIFKIMTSQPASPKSIIEIHICFRIGCNLASALS